MTHPAFPSLEMIDDNFRVVWHFNGEGHNGAYNPDDEYDEPLLRFTCYQKHPKVGWQAVVSHCSNFPATAHRRHLAATSCRIFEVLAAPDFGQQLELLSWVGPTNLADALPELQI